MILNYLNQHNEYFPSCVTYISCGGESCSRELLLLLQDRGYTYHFQNLYGPAECCIISTIWNISFNKPIPLAISIGNALKHTLAICLYEETLQPTLLDKEGELYIGGENLMKGYWNQIELSNSKIISHPVYGKLYRTGDIVKYGKEGQLIYCKRKDEQVKINGQRIELKEIENVLKQHPSVNETVCLILNNTTGSQLIAFVEIKDNNFVSKETTTRLDLSSDSILC